MNKELLDEVNSQIRLPPVRKDGGFYIRRNSNNRLLKSPRPQYDGSRESERELYSPQNDRYRLKVDSRETVPSSARNHNNTISLASTYDFHSSSITKALPQNDANKTHTDALWRAIIQEDTRKHEHDNDMAKLHKYNRQKEMKQILEVQIGMKQQTMRVKQHIELMRHNIDD